MDLYLNDLVRSRQSISDGKNCLTKLLVTIAILLSTALKLYALLVFFSRMQVQVFLISPNRTDKDHPNRKELFSDFITDFSFGSMVQ